MPTAFPLRWLTTDSYPLDSWSIQCSIHDNPNKKSWKETNDIRQCQRATILATDLLQVVTPVENLSESTNASGRITEHGKQDVPLVCLVTWMEEEEWRAIYPTPEDAGMTQKTHSSYSRHSSRVDRIQAMAFDFDGVSIEEMEEIFECFKDLTYIAYSSFSHMAPHKGGKACYRIICPLSKSLTPLQYNNRREGFWFSLQQSFPKNDEQTKDPSRLWYLPSYRIDREEHFDTRTNDGFAIDVDKVLAEVQPQPQTQEPPPTNTTQPPPANPTGQDQRAAGTDTNFRREFVKGDWEVRCHDDVLRPVAWIVANWDTLPKQSNGNYNCCRPGSHTVGSAFVHTHYNAECELNRFRITSVPSQTHWDCLETTHQITLNYDRRNDTGFRFRPNQNRQNVSKMIKILVDEGSIDIFSCSRNNIPYVGANRLGPGHAFQIESDIVQRWYHGGINTKIVNGGIEGYVFENRKDALLEKLESLERVDGTDLETVFIRYLNVEDTPLHRVMSKKWFIGTVARAFDHGCQNDTVLIFSGNQGVGKTTFWKLIAGRCDYTGRPFHKEGKVDINNKDSLLNFLQAWIFEWGELSGMNHKSKEDFKLLTSQQENTIRKAYGYFEDDILRKGVIVGSCNPDQNPLVDEENRRIWLMHCNTSSGDFSYTRGDLMKEVDAIWAEAVHLYKEGITGQDQWGKPTYKEDLWWLSGDERKNHIESNEKMKDDDIYYSMFYQFILSNPQGIFSGDQIIESIFAETYIDDRGEERKRMKVLKPPHKREVSRILRKIGCVYKTARVDGHPCKRWVFPLIQQDYTTDCEYEVSHKKKKPWKATISFDHSRSSSKWEDELF